MDEGGSSLAPRPAPLRQRRCCDLASTGTSMLGKTGEFPFSSGFHRQLDFFAVDGDRTRSGLDFWHSWFSLGFPSIFGSSPAASSTSSSPLFCEFGFRFRVRPCSVSGSVRRLRFSPHALPGRSYFSLHFGALATFLSPARVASSPMSFLPCLELCALFCCRSCFGLF